MKRFVTPLVLMAVLSFASSALAEEAAHGHAHETASPLWPLLFSVINLAIFLWVLARYVLPPVREWVHHRRSHVVQALEEAAAAKAEALRLRQEWEQRLAQFSRAVEEMQAQARQDAERERALILEAAHKTAEAIRRDAELAAAYEVRRTQELVRADLVRQAVRLAEEAARTQLTADDHQRFVAEFLKQVEQ
jgi:F-type H+-transporting ATPase subunit b